MLVNSYFRFSRSIKVSKLGEFRPWFLSGIEAKMAILALQVSLLKGTYTPRIKSNLAN
jgi:hypothetical protein